MSRKLSPKPLHWVDSGSTTLCGCPTERRRYIGPWLAKRTGRSIPDVQTDVTCLPCKARLESRARDAFEQPNPEPAPTPTPDTEDTPTPMPDTEERKPHFAPLPKPDLKSAPTAFNLQAYGPLGDAIQAYVETRARELATDIAIEAVKELGSQGPVSVDWTVNKEPFAKIEGAHHKILPQMLKLYAAGFRNFFIVGPAGTGKTTLARQMATALTMQFGAVSCTGGMPESALTGRAIPNLTTGETVFQTTEFVKCYEDGGVFLLDECDAADSNVLITLNSGLDNGYLPLPARVDNPTALRHENSVVIASANTWGTGADRQYVGRNQLDGAFMDRFVCATLEVTYDRDLEAALIGDPHICARLWQMRDKAAELKLRRVVGTRMLIGVTRLVKGAGYTLDAALIEATSGWTDDERSRVGIKGGK